MIYINSTVKWSIELSIPIFDWWCHFFCAIKCVDTRVNFQWIFSITFPNGISYLVVNVKLEMTKFFGSGVLTLFFLGRIWWFLNRRKNPCRVTYGDKHWTFTAYLFNATVLKWPLMYSTTLTHSHKIEHDLGYRN